jgi:hypothetical protein
VATPPPTPPQEFTLVAGTLLASMPISHDYRLRIRLAAPAPAGRVMAIFGFTEFDQSPEAS